MGTCFQNFTQADASDHAQIWWNRAGTDDLPRTGGDDGRSRSAINSEPGQGSTFKFNACASAWRQSKPYRSWMGVLWGSWWLTTIRSNRLLLDKMLADFGCQVSVADNGEAG